MKPLTPTQVQAEIKRRNAVFSKASPAQKRVLLAQDVIDQVRRGTIHPDTGCWAETSADLSIEHGEDSLREVLLAGGNPEAYCCCCADGALLVACTLYRNRVKVEEADDALHLGAILRGNEKDVTGFLKVFTPKQAILIELAYEMGDGYTRDLKQDDGTTHPHLVRYGISRDLAHKAVAFGNRFKTDRGCLLGIMRHIVKHKGEFVL